MKRKTKENTDIIKAMVTIQEQLAVMDNKLNAFMTKSLTELAQALAASKPAPQRIISAPATINTRPIGRPDRPMFTAICFDCGEDCEIPFKPSNNRPVYCRPCFAKRKSGLASNQNTPSTQTVSFSGTNSMKSTIIPAAKTKTPKKGATMKKASTKKKPSTKKKANAKKKIVKKKKTTRKKVVKKKKGKK